MRQFLLLVLAAYVVLGFMALTSAGFEDVGAAANLRQEPAAVHGSLDQAGFRGRNNGNSDSSNESSSQQGPPPPPPGRNSGSSDSSSSSSSSSSGNGRGRGRGGRRGPPLTTAATTSS